MPRVYMILTAILYRTNFARFPGRRIKDNFCSPGNVFGGRMSEYHAPAALRQYIRLFETSILNELLGFSLVRKHRTIILTRTQSSVCFSQER